MSQQVIDEIIAAFADVPLPKILRDPLKQSEEQEYERKARENLLGKDWKELDTKFLYRNSAAFEDLAPEAHQYYLPARMICSLNSSPDSYKVTYLVEDLLPNVWYLIYEGHDPEFDRRNSTLIKRQRYAVCSFLEAMFDEPFGLRNWSSQRLKWGWNIPDHPAHAKVRDYFDTLHNFHYPPAIKPKNRRLINLIRSSFADTPAPSGKVGRPMFRKHDDEPEYYALAFHGLNWRTLHPRLLGEAGTALCFLTDEELRYFLPAFMIADVWQADKFDYDRSNLSDFGDHSVDFHLATLVADALKDTPDQTNYSRYNRWADFTSPERKAIIAYLKFKLGRKEYRRRQMQIKKALKNYWLKTV